MCSKNAWAKTKTASYWRTRPVSERLAEIMRLRQERFGPDYAKAGIRKVVRVLKVKDGVEAVVLKESTVKDGAPQRGQ